MRRRFTAAVLTAAMSVTLIGSLQPASATHGCTDPSCTPITVAILEGIGFVCNAADIPGQTGERCTYRNDSIWTGPTGPRTQGLVWPGVGPPADGPFSFNAGPNTTLPTSACASTVSGTGCAFRSYGQLSVGDAGLGAYCGASKGTGVSTFTAQNTFTRATFGWRQSAATILPLEGTVTQATPATSVGASVVGFTSSRGTGNGGNCGITQVTTAFNVEGMIVTF